MSLASNSAPSTWTDEVALSGKGPTALIGGEMGQRGTHDEGLPHPASSIRDGFARRLKALRVSHGAAIGRPKLSTAEFAALLGVEAGRYRRYERAETEPPFWLLAAIRRITGASVDWLLDGCEHANLATGAARDAVRSGGWWRDFQLYHALESARDCHVAEN